VKEIKTANQFLRDLKLARKRGKDLCKIETVIDTLARCDKLAPNTVPTGFKAKWRGFGNVTSNQIGC
jgi:mRNA-degrading endonuclease YafQ of YafQ-DinJ toxin-antitoxin module